MVREYIKVRLVDEREFVRVNEVLKLLERECLTGEKAVMSVPSGKKANMGQARLASRDAVEYPEGEMVHVHDAKLGILCSMLGLEPATNNYVAATAGCIALVPEEKLCGKCMLRLYSMKEGRAKIKEARRRWGGG